MRRLLWGYYKPHRKTCLHNMPRRLHSRPRLYGLADRRPASNQSRFTSADRTTVPTTPIEQPHSVIFVA